ncbi:DUF389 domain-containing protein [Hymenobacter lapidiphilus]|uniref:DUF389 domain-containing protein n=1 Tax=Hymenobacter sp. CCM 8763 TaxID=2303334 RepID=UPI000E357A55|nr:DUF389 domain-containing protein [Hymenobacter sp. CCM 8763]RFP66314.1 DUF389 domain-containing protein [Hymenobacter sp. CCM 8763]
MIFVLLRWLRRRFDLTQDMGTPADIVQEVEEGLVFRGTNLWVLMFAILVASVGLNVNSTAVVIGAMLISPLMGPIVGIGFGAATVRVEIIQRGLSNLLLATVISLMVSATYFRLTPLTDAGTELLGRTVPTTWDVLIALFGGAAGAVALTRREKSNVLPGVAIATALMPPLCTAGYGLAMGEWSYMFGALYLFFINCVFIVLATLLVVKILPIPRATFTDSARARRVQLMVWGIALLTAAPSVYLAARIVRRTVFTHNAQRFVEEQFNLTNSYIVTRRLSPETSTINILLAGQTLSPEQLRALYARLPAYSLPDARLIVRQGLGRLDSADSHSLRLSLLEDVRSLGEQTLASYDDQITRRLRRMVAATIVPTGLPADSVLLREVRIEHPLVRQLGISTLIKPATDSLGADTVVVVALRSRQPLPLPEAQRLRQWLELRGGGLRRVRLLEQPEGTR